MLIKEPGELTTGPDAEEKRFGCFYPARNILWNITCIFVSIDIFPLTGVRFRSD